MTKLGITPNENKRMAEETTLLADPVQYAVLNYRRSGEVVVSCSLRLFLDRPSDDRREPQARRGSFVLHDQNAIYGLSNIGEVSKRQPIEHNFEPMKIRNKHFRA